MSAQTSLDSRRDNAAGDPTDAGADAGAQGAPETPLPASGTEQEKADQYEAELNETRRERLEMAKRIEDLKAAKMRRQIALLEADDPAPSGSVGNKDDDDPIDAPATRSGTPVAPPAPAARLRQRHVGALLSFVVLVVLPTALAAWYMWARAADRYVSYAGFSVRTEETSSAFELLGGIAELSGSSSSDTDILYKFIQSQEMVRRVDEELDLRTIWTRVDPGDDPVFAYHPPGTIEDMLTYWQRMVAVYSDNGTGLIDLQVQAFTAADALAISTVIYDESLAMINQLSAIAREDATRYAREELDQTVERLKTAREALTRFRNRTQIVDPAANIQSQMGILSSLQAQLAQTLIDLDILRQSTNSTDPRVTQAERRVEVIEARIAQERNKLGIGTGTGSGAEDPFADLVGEYERLSVDLEFAEQSYQSAQAAMDTALSEARRQSRYLAAHIQPTLPEAAEQPRRMAITALVALFAFFTWAILVLSAYALRDRR